MEGKEFSTSQQHVAAQSAKDRSMSAKQTMTLNLSAREMAVVEGLAAEMDLSKTAILRSALRLYQLAHMKAKQGQHMMFSGEPPMLLAVVSPGFGEPNAQPAAVESAK